MLKRFFLSRKTVLTLISLMFGTVVVGYIFPQRFTSSPAEIDKWQLANPVLAEVSKKLALDHVYTSPWFAALLLVFLVSLTVSTWEQFVAAARKTFAAAGGGGRSFTTTASEDEVMAVIREMGYVSRGGGEDGRRFVRNRWGYWGNILLHLGIVVSIASSLLIVLTEKRAVVHLLEGETHEPGAQWLKEEGGLIAGRFILPESVRLDRVVPEYWDTDDLKQLTTEFTFLGRGGETSSYSMHINKTIRYRGMRVFQGKNHGSSFFVEFVDADGKKYREYFELDAPLKRDKSSYRDFQLDWMPYSLQAKYYADADKRKMTGGNPLFMMRLMDGKNIVAELPLKIGETGSIGPYAATLVHASPWGGLIFIDITGMGGVFFGFFIIVLGGSLTYFCSPREFYVKGNDGGCRVSWRAAKFEHLYRLEFEEITKRFAKDTADEQ